LDPLGTRFLRGRIAHDGVNISKNQLALAWSQISAQVITVYAQILAFQKALDVVQENLKTTHQFLTQVDTRFQSGDARKSDLLRAKIEVSRAENELLIVEKDLKVSKGELNLLLGHSAEEEIVLSDSLSYEPLHIQYAGLVEKALDQRPDVQIEKTLLSSRKKGFWNAILKTFFPTMAIGVERSTQDFDNDTSLLLTASYPLWGFNLGQVKEAKAEKSKQAVRLEAFKKQVGLEVYRTFLETELADKQVVLQKKALDEANELLRQVTTQYEEGELAFLNYLENIRTIKETRLGYYNVLKNYQEKLAELERSFQKTPVPEGEK
jgi:multidrug efflux system outer membrane protein